MSEIRKCIKELAAAGVEAPGRLAGIEALDGDRTRHYRICDACTNIGKLVLQLVPAAGIHYVAESPLEVGENCGAEIVAAQKATNVTAAAEEVIQAAEQGADQAEPAVIAAELPVAAPELTPLISSIAPQPQGALA